MILLLNSFLPFFKTSLFIIMDKTKQESNENKNNKLTSVILIG